MIQIILNILRIIFLGFTIKKVRTELEFNMHNLKLFGVRFGKDESYLSFDFYDFKEKKYYHNLPTPKIQIIKDNGRITFKSNLDAAIMWKVFSIIWLYGLFEERYIDWSFFIPLFLVINILTFLFQYVDIRFLRIKIGFVEDEIEIILSSKFKKILEIIKEIEEREVYNSTDLNNIVKLKIRKIEDLIYDIQKIKTNQELIDILKTLEVNNNYSKQFNNFEYDVLEFDLNRIKVHINDNLFQY
jgi:hypothetical protein